MQKKIIITGGPSTGKSSIIKALSQKGYPCMKEISREVILEAREKGIEHLFVSSPVLFSEILLEKRIQQYFDAEKSATENIFFDRSVIDIIAYLNFANSNHTINFESFLTKHKYNLVFICPPWKEIHTTDNERYESFEEAKKIHNELIKSYKQQNYSVIEIPFGSIDQRTEFVLNNLH